MDETYTFDLGRVVERVVENKSRGLNGTAKSLYDKVRTNLFELSGIPVDVPLISYGEQPDPPIIKNTGKSILAEVIRKKLERVGISAVNFHDVLTDDIIGSNAEVFTNLGLLSSKACDNFGKQTYAKAPVPKNPQGRGDYVSNLWEVGGVQPLLKNLGLDLSYLRELARDKSLGEFNIAIREILEREILPFSFKRTSLSKLESALIKDNELLTEFLSFSGANGGGDNGIYVVWKETQETQIDSGYRRHFLIVDQDKVQMIDMRARKTVFTGKFEDVVSSERFYSFSLNASSRAFLTYLMAYDGVNVTGGGSTYNNAMSRFYTQRGFPQPVITCIIDPDFEAIKLSPLGRLFGSKENIVRVIENPETITRTDSGFGQILRSEEK